MYVCACCPAYRGQREKNEFIVGIMEKGLENEKSGGNWVICIVYVLPKFVNDI